MVKTKTSTNVDNTCECELYCGLVYVPTSRWSKHINLICCLIRSDESFGFMVTIYKPGLLQDRDVQTNVLQLIKTFRKGCFI